jgi:predicted nuclease with RNAse H fold
MVSMYVIRTFIHRGNGIAALPPTICFERELAIEMAEADELEAAGVAVYEIDPNDGNDAVAKPFAVFGIVPQDFRRIGRDALLAAPVLVTPVLSFAGA